MTEAITSADLAAPYDGDRRHPLFQEIEHLPDDPLREADLVGYYRMEDIVGSGEFTTDERPDSATHRSQAMDSEAALAFSPGITDFHANHHRIDAPVVDTPVVDSSQRHADLVGYFRSPDSAQTSDAGWAIHQGNTQLHSEMREEASTLEEPKSIPEPAQSSANDLTGFGLEAPRNSTAADAPLSPNDDVPHASEAPLIASETLSDWIERVREIGPTGLWLAYALRKARQDPSHAHLRLCHRAAKYVALSATGAGSQVAQTLLAEIAAVAGQRS